ncbi:DUF2306 domain-containing protein [Actinoplanes sp. NPDC049316]|uniref:DUF2306 domain-containing protein n=1 Tax=Actinoplanes sp. NPDC049316 TaxID=3154727 RepID=UPI003439A2D9
MTTDVTAAEEPAAPAPAPPARKRPAPRRSRRWATAGVILIGLLSATSIYLIWVYFNAGDPDTARYSMDEQFWFYPVVMVHMVGSCTALGTGALQIWPWLRRRRPRVHRICGQLYVWAGVYPAVVTSAILLTFWPEPLLNESSDILTTVLWFVSTATGYTLGRRGQYADHRRWMLRSFALTGSFTMSMILILPISAIFEAALYSHFDGNRELMIQAAAGVQVWLSWILPLLAVEWWLDYERLRAAKRRRAAVGTPRDRAAADI